MRDGAGALQKAAGLKTRSSALIALIVFNGDTVGGKMAIRCSVVFLFRFIFLPPFSPFFRSYWKASSSRGHMTCASAS